MSCLCTRTKLFRGLVRKLLTDQRIKGGEKMTKVGEVYLCEICGNKVKVVESGAGALVCCGEEMTLV